MPRLRSNIATNLAAGIWTIILTATITPLQVNLLGIESYGIIGFIATLQVAFSAFDMGLSSTLTREIAADQTEGRERSIALIRTASTVYWVTAVVIGGALALSVDTIATQWFNPQALDIGDLKVSLYLITLYLALRWPVALYTGILAGLQRLVIVNIVKIAVVSLRLIGGVLVILIWRDLLVFLIWTALTALIEVLAYYAASRRVCTFASWTFGFSLAAIRSVVRFSAAMMAMSILALFIVQLDRILISKLLPLDSFGYYMLAYNGASITSLAISAIATAMVPSFASWQAGSDLDILQRRYCYANRAILFLVGGACFPLIFFGRTILELWIGADAAAGAYRPMAVLAAGFWLSAAVSNAYSLAVGLGRPGLALQVSAASAVPYAIILYFLVATDGIMGAAWAWLALNFCYAATLVPIVHRKLLHVSTNDWLVRTIVPFAALGFSTFGLAWLVQDRLLAPDRRIFDLIGVAVGGTFYCLAGYWLLGERIRSEALALLGLRRPVAAATGLAAAAGISPDRL